MDPNACFSAILESLVDGDIETASYLAEDLIGWLTGGGFPPGDDRLHRRSLEMFLHWLFQSRSR